VSTEECRSCHAPIDWCVKYPEEVNEKTGLPKTIPIDHGSWDDERGNIAAWRGEPLALRDGSPGPSIIYARYITKREPFREGKEHRGISHFATCKQAGQWRGSNRAAREVTTEVTGRDPTPDRQGRGIPQAMPNEHVQFGPVTDLRIGGPGGNWHQVWPPGSNGEAANR
jgi:hypothetical protein